MKKVFLAQPFNNQDSAAVHTVVEEAVKNAGGSISRSDKLIGDGSLITHYSLIFYCKRLILFLIISDS